MHILAPSAVACDILHFCASAPPRGAFLLFGKELSHFSVTRSFLESKKTSEKSEVFESDRRGSNPRSRPWQGRALPTTPLSHISYSLYISREQDILYYFFLIMSTLFFIFLLFTRTSFQ